MRNFKMEEAPTKEDASDRYSEDDQNDESSEVESSQEGKGGDVNREQSEAIAKRETKFLFGMRLVVMAVLICSTCLLAYFVHKYLSTEEENEFHDKFESDAGKVLQAVGTSLDLTLGSVDALTVAMVSHAKATNQSWPFVNMPDFSVRAMKTLRLSKAVNIGAYYVVTNEQREAWENYTVDNHAWVNESIALQEADDVYDGPIIYDFHVTRAISDGWELPVPEADLYMPFWQHAPVIPVWAPYNFNGLTWTEAAPNFEQILRKHKVILGNAWLLPDPNDEEEMAAHEAALAWVENYVPEDQNADEPVSDFYYPILDVTDAISIEDPMKEDLVAVFSLTIYWRAMIEKILPPHSRGIIVVFSSPCNPTFTYQINGPEAVYIGRGDLHMGKYQDMEVSSNLIDLTGVNNGDSFYSGIPIDEEWCPFTIRMYPSKENEDEYITNDPIVFSIIVAGIFVFTSLVFVCYDSMVELRQRRVMNQATESSEIVASLFPKAVRDRLYEEAKEKREVEKKKNHNPAFRNGVMGQRDLAAMMESGDIGHAHDIKSRPIADLFQNTTIFFADLVGFTKWSSKRSPEDVFVLLETIYGAFDAIAEKRGVFKVETIGDCYVAATGIPKPQENHAVIMVKFAQDCLHRMQQVIADDLADRLGPDTRDLKMRVGLHSGPTTAGVLRGIKGRFQLFGDTVNMASRMESTGMPGRIQVSEDTAEELTQKGKARWLVANDELVSVKGKGDVLTYFVSFGGARTAAAPSSGTPSSGTPKHHGNSLASNSDSDEEDNGSIGAKGDFEHEELRLEDKLHGYLRKNERTTI